MNNSLTEQLGIRAPVIQAPMAGVSDSALAIAVGQAGGLGSLPCAMSTEERIQEEVALIRNAGDLPINLNFFCHQAADVTEAQNQRWYGALKPYFDRFNLDPDPAPASGGRQPFGASMASLIEALRPEVVSFHFGLPDTELLARVKTAGAFVLSSATTLDEAIWLNDHGADAVIAQGIGAGGHRGLFLSDDLDKQVDTITLVQQIKATMILPVIAAGGISTAEGAATARAAGADAVQVGTAFLLCPECRTSDIHRAALKSPRARETAVTNVYSGRPARAIVSDLMREIGPMCPDTPPFPYAGNALARIRQAAEEQSISDFSPLWCGTDPSGCAEIPAGEIVRRLAGDPPSGQAFQTF